MNNKPKQNKISENYLTSRKNNLAKKEKQILEDASKKTGFKPEKAYYRSHWWTSKEFGALTYKGKYKNKKAIIKIQGVKPSVSEIYMIKSFEKNNKSKIIRPPHLYTFLDWDDNLKYEALISEDVGHDRIINSPTNAKEIDEFYNIYNEYRMNCLNNPWVEKPYEKLSLITQHSFDSWKKITLELYQHHPLRKKEDPELIERAIKLLTDNFDTIELEFMHGHFSIGDLIKVDNQIILRSNLYWSWKNPFRDAVFAFHWFMLNLYKLNNISEAKINEQRDMWLDKIYKIPKNREELRLLKLAHLERSTASLNLDALSINPQTEVSKYLVEQTRQDVLGLIDELS